MLILSIRGKHALDDSSYTSGCIAGKPIVLCQCALTVKLGVSIIAKHMRLNFENIELLLLVGIARGNHWTSDG